MTANSRTTRALGLAAAAAALALSGCGNPGMPGPGTTTAAEQPTAAPATTETTASTPSPASSAAAASAKILIKGFTYKGAETVSPGTEITVTNEDIEAHTITADTGAAFDANIKPGTGTFTAPTEPGTYPYHCTFHGNMKGTLTVK
ncbi:cupredoxin domain-containing protein [Pseudarthrobacter sp. AL07]|uniref:cupredoxin domain-containing protein n=1 Tax=unclassified Pseudarthrobacter TaxID=2647000 RepID=UPI00249B2C84|nr:MULTISPECIES: cupredoxin domain-containing protein [unclassified Pseudarthrobacter]MDI3196225.1 cupredoxin domain-containing protein [Pseudarthrobacter sp. AL20]MDI3210294.1 cupredoxin domain-containing protein [Pseudarthrobacter sp. AL07]